jgi:hypothetical protein
VHVLLQVPTMADALLLPRHAVAVVRGLMLLLAAVLQAAAVPTLVQVMVLTAAAAAAAVAFIVIESSYYAVSTAVIVYCHISNPVYPAQFDLRFAWQPLSHSC